MKRLFLLCVLFAASHAFGAACGAPGISPTTGTVTGVQSVTMSDGTSCTGGYICYTTDGTTAPVSSSGTSCSAGTHYTGAISTNVTTTFKAAESSASRTISSVTTSTVTIQLNQPEDIASSANNDITATFTDTGWTGPTVTFCYTTGTGSQASPTTSAAGTCSGAPTITYNPAAKPVINTTATVLKIIATRSGNTDSILRTTSAFTLTVGATTCTPTSGPLPIAVTCSIATTTGATINYCDTSASCTVNSGSSTWSNTTVTLPDLRVIGTKTNYVSSAVNTYAYTVAGTGRGMQIF